MAFIEKSIEINVPVETAYNQWTQFESFPNFMEGVESVDQLDDRRLHWRATVGGQTHEWDAEITEQLPDNRIAWRNASGAVNAGVVTFHRVTSDSCRVALQLEYSPEGVVEQIGDALGLVSRTVEGDLERFRNFIERQGVESGAWRGTVERPPSNQATPLGAGATTRTGTGEFGNRGSTDMGGVPDVGAARDLPGFGLGRGSTQNLGSDNARAAVGADASPATHQDEPVVAGTGATDEPGG